jgi:hypothetical protein
MNYYWKKIIFIAGAGTFMLLSLFLGSWKIVTTSVHAQEQEPTGTSTDIGTLTSTTTSIIGATVSGNENSNVSLGITSIDPGQSAAVADDTYADGWSWIFNITVPDDQTNLQMEFTDWTNTSATSTSNAGNIIPVAGNMEISSPQANSVDPIIMTSSDTYSLPLLLMGNTASTTGEQQVQVIVQMKIPSNTADGSYTTTYGIQSY